MRTGANWTAIGAGAAVVTALVALLAYIWPNSGSSSVAGPAPPGPTYSSSAPSTYDPFPQPTSGSLGSITPAGRPAGCSDAIAAVARYKQTEGSTQASQATAASQAYNDLMIADFEAQSNATSTVMMSLERDFDNIYNLDQYGTDQNIQSADAQANSDIATLSRVCAAS